MRAFSSINIIITPCDFIEIRLMDVRIPWEPSSFAEDRDRKNVFFELRDPDVRAFLQAQEERWMQREGGQSIRVWRMKA